ncbi:MAG: ACP S-malonyltransferase [Chloroflexi bacterium]|nr:ACP S-malonyltransferase [Chloroflexota bacterium]
MLAPATTAYLFPGQGSQTVGMGHSLAEAYHVARQTFQEADDVLGFGLTDLCFNGPEDALNDTANAQPALYAAGIAALRVLYEAWDTDFQPAFTAGHSLGEFTALTAAGALTYPDGLLLVRRRGELMRDAGEHQPGGMAALLGPTLEAVQALCDRTQAETGGVLVIANDNCPGQVVVSGSQDAVAYAVENAGSIGAKRAVRLNVSVATHSPLMQSAAHEFAQTVAATPLHPPRIPVVGNTTGQVLTDVDAIRAELNAQLTGPVRWTDSIRTMVDAGVTHFLEIGAGKVLTGLLRRIDRGAAGIVVDSPDGITQLQAST